MEEVPVKGHATPLALIASCALLALVGCSGDPANGTYASPAEATATMTVPSPTDPGLPTVTPPPSTAAAATPSATAGSTAMIPEVTGLRLAEGEERLRARGMLTINVVDASGAGRTILEKDNWVIVSQHPEAGTPADTTTALTLNVSKPTDSQPTINAVEGKVPDVVCRDLQTAQDALRAAGFYLLLPKDGLGQGRFPLVDRNWIVVGQSAPSGSSPAASTRIELTVVKYGEPTGKSGCSS
ncbi:PASTA domain-containing protein [Micromonospora sp. NPDC047467]|uniref:PASTA domain-containing protein n=1 Tax=Micromonospora sp. NPDC047467 TaxID=3154814 RepID=UPI0034004316